MIGVYEKFNDNGRETENLIISVSSVVDGLRLVSYLNFMENTIYNLMKRQDYETLYGADGKTFFIREMNE